MWKLLQKGIPRLDATHLGLLTTSSPPFTCLGLARGGRAVASAVLGRAVVLMAVSSRGAIPVLVLVLVLLVLLVAILLTASMVVEARGGHTSIATHRPFRAAHAADRRSRCGRAAAFAARRRTRATGLSSGLVGGQVASQHRRQARRRSWRPSR